MPQHTPTIRAKGATITQTPLSLRAAQRGALVALAVAVAVAKQTWQLALRCLFAALKAVAADAEVD
ncbi:MAG: hypothetical protein LBT53_07865 [Puniceicoccales bacterium]|nr:hypothetical protein [Puniceicoccales bacterium]